MAKTARFVGWAWISLGVVLVLIGYASTIYFRGFDAVKEMLDPFSGHGIINTIVILVTLAPGFILTQAAGALERGKRRRSILSLALFPIAASLAVGLVWYSLRTSSSNAQSQSPSVTCTDYSSLTEDQKMSMAYGYLEGVQAALDKEPIDVLVPLSDLDHPLWWIIPTGLRESPYAGLAQRLDIHCQSAKNRHEPLLDAFLSLASKRKGSPSLGISFDKKKTDPWKRFLGGSVSCSAYRASSQGTRQAIVYGYYLGTQALKKALKSSVDIGIVWPSALSVEAVREEIDKACHESGTEFLRDALWLTTTELAVKQQVQPPKPKLN